MDDRIFHSSIVGVRPDADFDEIRSAFLESAKILHPDKHANSDMATRKFQQLQASYDWLVANLEKSRSDNSAGQSAEVKALAISISEKVMQMEPALALARVLSGYYEVFKDPDFEADSKAISIFANSLIEPIDFGAFAVRIVDLEFSVSQKKQSLFMKFAMFVESAKVAETKKEVLRTMLGRIFEDDVMFMAGITVISRVSSLEKLSLVLLSRMMGEKNLLIVREFLSKERSGSLSAESSTFFLNAFFTVLLTHQNYMLAKK